MGDNIGRKVIKINGDYYVLKPGLTKDSLKEVINNNPNENFINKAIKLGLTDKIFDKLDSKKDGTIDKADVADLYDKLMAMDTDGKEGLSDNELEMFATENDMTKSTFLDFLKALTLNDAPFPETQYPTGGRVLQADPNQKLEMLLELHPGIEKKVEFKNEATKADLNNYFAQNNSLTDNYKIKQQREDKIAFGRLILLFDRDRDGKLGESDIKTFLTNLNEFAKNGKNSLEVDELVAFAQKFGVTVNAAKTFINALTKEVTSQVQAPPLLDKIALEGDKTYVVKDNLKLSKEDFANFVAQKYADKGEYFSSEMRLQAKKFIDAVEKYTKTTRADGVITKTEAKLAFTRLNNFDMRGNDDGFMSEAELEKFANAIAGQDEALKAVAKEFVKPFIEAVSKVEDVQEVEEVGNVSDPGPVDGNNRHQQAIDRYMQGNPEHNYVVHYNWSMNRVLNDILENALGIPADQITLEDRQWLRNQLKADGNRTYPYRTGEGFQAGQILKLRLPVQQDITRESELEAYRNRHRNRTVQGGGGGGRTDNTPRQQDNVTPQPQPQPVVVPGGNPCDDIPEGQVPGRTTSPDGSDTAVTDPLNPNGQSGSVDGGQGQNQDGGVAEDYRDEETDLLVKESVTNHDLSSVRLATSLENANPGQEFRNNHSTKKISSDTVLVTHDGKEYALRKEIGKKNKSVTYKYMDKENPQNVVETVQMELKDKDETKPTKITTTDANGTRVQERKYDNNGVIKSLKEKNQAGQVTKEMIKDEDGKCWLVNYTNGTGNTRTLLYYAFDPAKGTASEQCSKVVAEDTNGNNIVRRSTFDRDKKTVFEESFTDGGKRYNGTMLFNNVEVDEQTQMPKKVNGKYVSNDYQKAYYDESKKLFIRVTCKDGIETTIDSEADKIKPKENLLEVECAHPLMVRKKTLATGEFTKTTFNENQSDSIIKEVHKRTLENGLFRDVKQKYDDKGKNVVRTTEAKQFVAGQNPQTIKLVQTATKKGDPELTTIYFYDKDGKKLGYATRCGNQDRYYVEGSESEVLLESAAFKKVLENTVIYKQAFDSQELKNPAK